MESLAAYFINISIYSMFPFFIMLTFRNKEFLLYIYISTVFLWGALANGFYSFILFDTIKITGGSIAYGAFMMSIVMLIILERRTRVFFNLFSLVLFIYITIFIIFKYLEQVIKTNLAVNVLQITPDLFNVSIWVLIIGGTLIVLEIFILFVIFLYFRNKIFNINTLSLIYTLTFIFIMCLDGLLFPLFAINISGNFKNIILESILSKLLLAISYSMPMLIFFSIFKKNTIKFVNTPLLIENIIAFRDKSLTSKLYKYELRYHEQQNKMKKLIELADIDSLTSLANKRKFEASLYNEWRICFEKRLFLTIAIGDVDFFKQYNDMYGHLQGDNCLKTIADSWNHIAKKPSDLAARIGGEEFAVIAHDTTPEQIYPLLVDFLKELEEKHITHETSRIADHVTMSIGVAGCMPEEPLTPLRLFEMADKKLYIAKETGRNRIVSD